MLHIKSIRIGLHYVHINTNKYVNKTYPRLQANGGGWGKDESFLLL